MELRRKTHKDSTRKPCMLDENQGSQVVRRVDVDACIGACVLRGRVYYSAIEKVCG